jgi:hypothetical protein
MAEIDPELLKRLMDSGTLSSLQAPDAVQAPPMQKMGLHQMDRTLLQPIVPSSKTQDVTPPDLGGLTAPGTLPGVGTKSLPNLGYKERQALPNISPGAPAGSAASYQSQLEKLQDQKANPWGSDENHPGTLGKIGHGLAKIGNIAGDILAPGTTALIPGTDLNRERQINQIEPKLARAEQQEAGQKEAQAKTDIEDRKATTEEDKEKLAEKVADQPKPKEEEWSVVPGFQGPNGEPVQQEKNSGQLRVAPAGTGAQAKTEKADDFEKFYKDYITDNHLPDSAHNRLLARKEFAAAGQAPERQPHQMVIGPDGKVIELKPGSQVAPGTKTVSGDLAVPKATPDEQRRADLAENLNENLGTLEEIVNRRPDLFGPVAGRVTQAKGWLGSDDPDIGALETIKHQIGMAQISAHGMRSAQGVEGAATSILNSFKNGPDAVKGSINAARNSVKTFTGDVEKAKAGGGNAPAKKEETDANDPLGILPKKKP